MIFITSFPKFMLKVGYEIWQLLILIKYAILIFHFLK
ncbi:hypothetical protein B0I18_105169 [Taibaiella chishuiensis]|uniref:Uncharacterized protein n=1 Tax=Taibaiella chishuiensis TaxID=1434707 RepID=A0A2P8D2Y5_9BACT|nr:hypothetical protein B0I18_105169 [Taibaiella chishuiensis]